MDVLGADERVIVSEKSPAPARRGGGANDAARRVALVVTEGWWFWSCWVELAKAIRDAGYKLTVVTRSGEHGDRIRSLGFDLVEMDLGRGRLSPWTNLRTLWRLRAAYRRLRPDLVHHVALQPSMLGSAAAALAGRPAIVNTIAGMGHALSSGGVRRRVVERVLLPVLGRTLRRSHTLVQNPDDAALIKDALGMRPGRVIVVRGAGVDVGRFAPRPEPTEGPVRVAMVSRMLWSKGVREFVDAAAIVRGRRGDVAFALVGAPDPGNPDTVPPEQLEAWAASGDVAWWGHREDIAGVWARSHIAVLPSWYREGVPNALLEAAACGRPIITTDMPGCREAARHGENGLLVPPRDARALADAILKLVDAPALRAEMGRAGRRRAETEFAAARIHGETLAVYDRALVAR